MNGNNDDQHQPEEQNELDQLRATLQGQVNDLLARITAEYHLPVDSAEVQNEPLIDDTPQYWLRIFINGSNVGRRRWSLNNQDVIEIDNFIIDQANVFANNEILQLLGEQVDNMSRFGENDNYVIVAGTNENGWYNFNAKEVNERGRETGRIETYRCRYTPQNVWNVERLRDNFGNQPNPIV